MARLLYLGDFRKRLCGLAALIPPSNGGSAALPSRRWHATALHSLLFSSGISFFSSYVSGHEHANIRSTKSYAQTYITAQPCTQSLSQPLSSLSLTRARAVPHMHTDAVPLSPYAHTRPEHVFGSRRLLRREELSLSPRAACCCSCTRCARSGKSFSRRVVVASQYLTS